MISVPAGQCLLCDEIIYCRADVDDKKCKCGAIEHLGRQFYNTNARVVCLYMIDKLILDVDERELTMDVINKTNKYGRIEKGWMSRL